MPTIFDLLNNAPEENSFAFALRKNRAKSIVASFFKTEDYEDCQILSQPYHESAIVILRDKTKKYVYRMQERDLQLYDLQEDPQEKNPVTIANDVSYSTLKEMLFCKRYRDLE